VRGSLHDGNTPTAQNWKRELALFSSTGTQELRRQVEITRKSLQSFAQKSQNLETWIVIAPPAFVVDTTRLQPTFKLVGLDPGKAKLNAPQEAIHTLSKELGLQVCDLTEALRNGQEKEDMYFTYDGHWTPSGHAVVAETLQTCMAAP